MPGLSYYGYEDPNQRKNIFSTEGWLGAMAGGMGMEAMGKGMGGTAFGAKQAGGKIFGRAGGLAAREMMAAEAFGAEAAAAVQNMRYPAAATVQYGAGQTPLKLVGPGRLEQALDPRFAKPTAAASAAKARSLTYSSRGTKLIRSGRILMGVTLFTQMYEMGKAALDSGSSFRKTKQELAEARSKVYDEDTFSDSRAAFTQRQRAIQVIHNSQMGVRSAMGNEASYLHF